MFFSQVNVHIYDKICRDLCSVDHAKACNCFSKIFKAKIEFFTNIRMTRNTEKKRAEVANFADIIKNVITFTKTTSKTQEKLKELEIMYEIAIYICISWYSKICWFPVKKSWFIYFLDLLYIRHNCAKFHYYRICMADFTEGAAPPTSVSSPEKAHP